MTSGCSMSDWCPAHGITAISQLNVLIDETLNSIQITFGTKFAQIVEHAIIGCNRYCKFFHHKNACAIVSNAA